jgi:4-hydroxy-3-methylbut-2-enyl diphosphate reductase
VTVEKALDLYGPPIYVRKQIVHNRHVVASLEERGAVFVEELDEVPEGATVVFSAHGVAPVVHTEAAERRLKTIDATCPLVTKVHLEARRFAAEGYQILLIGHEGHEEVVGTMGEAPEAITLIDGPGDVAGLEVEADRPIVWLSQTTLSVDETMATVGELKTRFPGLMSPPSDDICYATQNRQEAVRILAEGADVVIVLGSQNSSNSQRLAELARERGIAAHLIDGANEIDPAWFTGEDTVVITAGASAPESVVQDCVAWLKNRYGATVEERTIREEDVYFPLPKELRAAAAAAQLPMA